MLDALSPDEAYKSMQKVLHQGSIAMQYLILLIHALSWEIVHEYSYIKDFVCIYENNVKAASYHALILSNM